MKYIHIQGRHSIIYPVCSVLQVVMNSDISLTGKQSVQKCILFTDTVSLPYSTEE